MGSMPAKQSQIAGSVGMRSRRSVASAIRSAWCTLAGRSRALTNTHPDHVLEASVVGHPLLEWAGHVTQVRLGRVVEQCHELVLFRHQLGEDAAVLGDTVELAGVTIDAAQVGQRVRNVAWIDHFGVRPEEVEELAGVGEDPVHAASFTRSASSREFSVDLCTWRRASYPTSAFNRRSNSLL